MPFLVSRADTGQFVLTDSATDTVVIDDDLGSGYAKLEQIVAAKPAVHPESAGVDPAAPGFIASRGGPRYTAILLAVVLPFAWLAVLYFALANLLAETALDRRASDEAATKIEALERELHSLRSEIAGAPRTPKTRAPKPKPKPKLEPKPAASVSPR